MCSLSPKGSLSYRSRGVGKGITQGSLQVALLLALLANRRLIFRPNAFMFLLTLLAIETILTLFGTAHLKGTSYRTFRYIEFVAILWLLTPYWGRRDMLLVRCHLKAMAFVLCTVVLGLLVAPGRATNGGRLGGVIWPIPATQVAHYAAVSMGMVIVLWFSGIRSGRLTLYTVIPAAIILVLTHTRTALLAAGVGVIVAGLSVILHNARVRRLFISIGVPCRLSRSPAAGGAPYRRRRA